VGSVTQTAVRASATIGNLVHQRMALGASAAQGFDETRITFPPFDLRTVR
jgi:hypothetical protein